VWYSASVLLLMEYVVKFP